MPCFARSTIAIFFLSVAAVNCTVDSEETFDDVTLAAQGPTTKISTFSDATLGYAFYLTGSSDELGNWNTAYRMELAGQQWSIVTNAPLGEKFKLVRAPWELGESTSTVNVEWEVGCDHYIPGFLRFVELTPSFDPELDICIE